jgi:hypothetical protein
VKRYVNGIITMMIKVILEKTIVTNIAVTNRISREEKNLRELIFFKLKTLIMRKLAITIMKPNNAVKIVLPKLSSTNSESLVNNSVYAC